MAKSGAKRRRSTADAAFRRAWQLLGRLERRLERARTEEAKRTRQQATAKGDAIAKRAAQLTAAHAEVTEIEGLLTELSELIVANARAQAGQVVKDVVPEAAGAVRDAAARQTKPAARRAPKAAAAQAPRPAARRTKPAARQAPKPASSVGSAPRRSRTKPPGQASRPTDPTAGA